MPTVKFLGKVHPDAYKVSVDSRATIGWSVEELGLRMSIQFSIKESAAEINCDLNNYQPSYLPHIYIRALDTVRAAVNLLGFVLATGLTVSLDTFIDPEQNTASLVPNAPILAGICTVLSQSDLSSNAFDDTLKIVLSEPSLFAALNDLMVGITQHHQAPIVGARAVERLRHLIAPGSSVNDGWAALRENLRIERPYVQFITDLSVGPRHGDPTYVPGEPTTETIRRAWVIMNRFLEYRKRGNLPLPISEFPSLTS
jgi:hypothetical protein